jgi:chorismate lyase/3-hydroxybenzoate synthase
MIIELYPVKGGEPQGGEARESTLGGFVWGATPGPVHLDGLPAVPLQQVPMPLLGVSGLALSGDTRPLEACLELWRLPGCEGVREQGQADTLVWASQADVLCGVMTLDEALCTRDPQRALEWASATVYQRIFERMKAAGFPYLWRVWNYFPRMHEGANTRFDRYQQFNSGRQAAFGANGHAVTGNVPAASAIGLAQGALTVAFFAGRCPAVAIENPHQMSAYDYPVDYGLRRPIFSRAVWLDRGGSPLLLISGTASIIGHASCHAQDVQAQCAQILAHIATLRDEAYRQQRHRDFPPFSLEKGYYRVYLRRTQDYPLIRAMLEEHWGKTTRIVYLQGDLCRQDLLLEIEAVIGGEA